MKTIEFAGLPHAGKSTLIKALGHILYLAGCSNQTIQKDMRMPGAILDRKNYYDRQLMILLDTISEIIRLQDSSKADILFVHRGLLDSMMFFLALSRLRLISKDQRRNGIVLARENIFRIDSLVIVKIPVEISLSPERTYVDTSGQEDLVRNKDFLEALYQEYIGLEKSYKGELLIIDGTRPIDENLKILLETTFPACEAIKQ